MKIYENELGPQHIKVAEGLLQLARVLREQNALAKSQSTLQRALAIYEAALGPNHSEVAHTLKETAKVLALQGKLSVAQPLLERAVAIHEAAYGTHHLEVATTLSLLAQVMQGQGDLGSASPCYERAVRIFEDMLGANHPEVAAALTKAAQVLKEQGDLDAARVMFERALAIDEATVGPDHPNVAVAATNLAIVLRQQGELARAKILLKRARVIHEAARDGAVRLDTAPTAASPPGLARITREKTCSAPHGYLARGQCDKCHLKYVTRGPVEDAAAAAPQPAPFMSHQYFHAGWQGYQRTSLTGLLDEVPVANAACDSWEIGALQICDDYNAWTCYISNVFSFLCLERAEFGPPE